jgi:hypothetical protein
MRTVGPRRNDNEFELDPARALQRGRRLDEMLRAARPPILRGVRRGTVGAFQKEDEARARAAARRINAG